MKMVGMDNARPIPKVPRGCASRVKVGSSPLLAMAPLLPACPSLALRRYVCACVPLVLCAGASLHVQARAHVYPGLLERTCVQGGRGLTCPVWLDQVTKLPVELPLGQDPTKAANTKFRSLVQRHVCHYGAVLKSCPPQPFKSPDNYIQLNP